MAADTDALVLDLVEWIAARSRPYADVLEAWRTSCPRLTIWEDAVERGYVASGHRNDGRSMVYVTPAGREFLTQAGRLPDTAGSIRAA